VTPPLGPPASVPTLTEVVDLGEDVAAAPAPVPESSLRPPPSRETAAAIDGDAEAALAARVLERLQVQIDRMLEVRLREALAPALVRTADALVRDARRELVGALREAVERAVRDARDDAPRT
jgi:hypothetical protein